MGTFSSLQLLVLEPTSWGRKTVRLPCRFNSTDDVYVLVNDERTSYPGCGYSSECPDIRCIKGVCYCSSGITKGLPFVAVDLSTLPETLVESELFGHVKGAFTGAVKDRKGRFEIASDGTVFLDEISEIPLNLQVKLLRILQEREFEPVGDGVTIPMKARIISATNRNLEELVRQGKFREDLFYRISVFRIDLPPLRERKEDLPALVAHILQKINRDLHKNVTMIPHEVLQILQNHPWVGNIRELENVLMQAVVLAKGDTLDRENIIFRDKVDHDRMDERRNLSLDLVEKEHIEYVLSKTNWDKTEAAKLLNISRHTLYNKIKAYGIVQR